MPEKSTTTEQLRSLLPEQNLVEALFALPVLRDLPFRSLLETGVKLFLLLLLFLFFNWGIRALIRRTGDRLANQRAITSHPSQVARIRTLTTLAQSFVFYLLLFFFGVGALGLLGVNVMGLIGTAGVAGLAVGFGAQKLVKDVISGFFLLLEDQYAVGEYVTVAGVTGTVEELGMRSTRLRDDDGRLYILSNGDISQVCNFSRGAVVHSFDIGIGAAAEPEKAIQVLNEALEPASNTLELPEPAKVAGISATDAAKTTLRVTFRSSVRSGTTRPNDIAYSLRDTARTALLKAEIPLA